MNDGGELHRIAAADVLGTSVVPLAVGLTLTAVLALRWVSILRLAQVVGGGAGILSAAGPLLADADGGTRPAPAVMHVVAGLAVVVALELVRRHRLPSPGRA